jgi:hypothetical protein
MNKLYRPNGKNKDGEFLIQRPDTRLNKGLMCCGTWKTKADAINWCAQQNKK